MKKYLFILLFLIFTGIFPKDLREIYFSGEKEERACIKDPHIEFFMYHYIRDYEKGDSIITRGLSVPPAIFEMHMRKVHELSKEKKIFLMRGERFLDRVEKKCFPGDPVWIFTADDGWSDMYDTLVPIASRYEVPFFLGIVTDFVGKKGFITEEDLRDIATNPYMTISTHSKSHKNHSKLDEKSLEVEICDAKTWLEEKTEGKIRSYIYPSGRINTEYSESLLKKCGYTIAWSTELGSDYGSSSGSLYRINRRRITGDTAEVFFDELLKK